MTKKARPGFVIEGLVALAGFVLSLYLLYLALNWVVGVGVAYVPTELEEQLAASEVGRMEAKVLQAPALQGALDAMVAKLEKATPGGSPYRFRMRAVQDRTENAFALPGGEMFVTTGLLAASSSPDELAGIVGHEMQHVLGRHSLKAMGLKLGVQLSLMALIGDVGISSAVAQGSSHLLGLSFDRDQERESDRLGIGMAHRAGYDPTEVANFFERHREAGDTEVAEGARALFSDHPADGARIQAIRQLSDKLKPARPHPSPAQRAAWRGLVGALGGRTKP
jgi:predicted Zn-dependent protease